MTFLREWLTSAGFGGTAAVVAALVAYLGVRKTVRQQRLNARKDQWWERARWALDRTLSEDARVRAVGFSVLEALGDSEYAAEHEFDVVDAAMDAQLAGYADPRETVADVEEWDDTSDEGAESE